MTATKEGVGTSSQTGNVTQGRPVDIAFKLAPAAAGGVAGAAGGDPKAAAELQALAAAATAAATASNWDEAIAKYTELVGKAPTCAECFLQLGNAHAMKKSYADAETAYKQSITVRESPEAYNGLVRIYNDQKKFDLAAEAGGKAACALRDSGRRQLGSDLQQRRGAVQRREVRRSQSAVRGRLKVRPQHGPGPLLPGNGQPEWRATWPARQPHSRRT